MALKAKIPRYYIGCNYLIQKNKIFYSLLILSQLLQSTGFSGLFDIP